MKNKILLKMPAGTCEAYELTPDHKGKFPAVLMYMDAIGVREGIIDLAQQIADQGFVVLLPNLFYRSHDLPIVEYPEGNMDQAFLKSFFPGIRPYMNVLSPEALTSDAEIYLDHLLQHESVNSKTAGIVGYCFGGGHAVRTAAKYPSKVGAVVSLHGGNLAKEDDKASPHLYLKSITAPMYFGHADHDESMPFPMIQRLEQECISLKKDYVSEIYQGAHHGFTQSDIPAFNPEAANLSFQNTIQMFKKLK